VAGTALAYSKTLMPSAHHVLGVGLVIQGRPQDAIGALRTYLRLAPQASNAGTIREHLKLLELQRRQRLRGLHCSQIALDIGPTLLYFFMYKSAIAPIPAMAPVCLAPRIPSVRGARQTRTEHSSFPLAHLRYPPHREGVLHDPHR